MLFNKCSGREGECYAVRRASGPGLRRLECPVHSAAKQLCDITQPLNPFLPVSVAVNNMIPTLINGPEIEGWIIYTFQQ
jgi:hypothetical protein